MEIRKIEKSGDSIFINGATLQKEEGEKRNVKGRVFDIFQNFGDRLSLRDPFYQECVYEFYNSCWSVSIPMFAKYLMHARVIVPLGGYGTMAYFPKGVEEKYENLEEYYVNHGAGDISYGMGSGFWDPSEVLGDLAVICKLEFEKPEIFDEARDLILKGFSVNYIGTLEDIAKEARNVFLSVSSSGKVVETTYWNFKDKRRSPVV